MSIEIANVLKFLSLTARQMFRKDGKKRKELASEVAKAQNHMAIIARPLSALCSLLQKRIKYDRMVSTCSTIEPVYNDEDITV